MAERYILLECGVAFDNDDYGVWADIIFDTKNKELTYEKYGHGIGPKYVKEGYTKDLSKLNLDDFFSSESVKNYFAHYSAKVGDRLYDNYKICLPVKIVGGRKFRKEEGVIYLGKKNIRNGYLSYMYGRDYEEVLAMIYCPQKNTIEYINPSYLDIDKHYFCDTIQKAISDNIKNISVKRIAHLVAYDISYYHCDYENQQESIFDIIDEILSTTNVFKDDCEDYKNIIDNAIDSQVEKEKNYELKKFDKLKENGKYKDICEWAKKQNPSKEEQMFIIARTLSKYYGINTKLIKIEII